MSDLTSNNRSSWIEVQSEIHEGGAECPIWFLVEGKDKAISSWEIFLATINPYLEKCENTEFTVSFQQIDGDKIIWWDALDDDDIRTGRPSTDIFKYPDCEKIGPHFITVFTTVKRYVVEHKLGT